MHDQLNQEILLLKGEKGLEKIITAKIIEITKGQYKLESQDCQIPIFLSKETLERCQKITQDFLATGSSQENSNSVPADFI